MENGCLNCIQYKYDQKQLCAEECANCHERKCIIQYYDGVFGGKCDACGMTFVADLNTVCELDEVEYKVYYAPMEYSVSEIKKILGHVSDNVYKIKRDTELGSLIVEGKLYQVISTLKWLMEENILFHVIPVNSLEKYSYWKHCRYRYCLFQ